jgi:hypothetical protein
LRISPSAIRKTPSDPVGIPTIVAVSARARVAKRLQDVLLPKRAEVRFSPVFGA